MNEKKDLKLSVAIPNYNHGCYLKQCIYSVMTQTRKPEQIFVIDDSSTDDSLNVVNDLKIKFPEIELHINHSNQGVVRVINQALNIAKHNYVLILAADDWLMPNMIEKSMNLLTENPQAGYCSSLSFQLKQRENYLSPFYSPVPRLKPCYISNLESQNLLSKYDSWTMGNTVILNKKHALAQGGFQHEMLGYCDNFMYKELALRFGCCFIPEALGVWRVTENNFSKSIQNNVQKLNQVRDFKLAHMKKLESSDIFTKKIISRWCKRWQYLTKNQLINNKFKRLFLFLKYRHFDILTVLRQRILWRTNFNLYKNKFKLKTHGVEHES